MARSNRADVPNRRRADTAARGTPVAPAHGHAGGPRVLVGREGGVATLTLDRPLKRNELDRRSIAELRAAVTECDLAADVRVVALRGAGKDFCAGFDLDEPSDSAGLPPEENERRAMELGEVFLALRALPKVTVAVVRGQALAAGCALASACDLVVARAGSRFGCPEIDRGLVPALALAMLRSSVGGKTAFDLAVTGRVLDAEEALRVGLVSRVLPAGTFESDITKLLTSLAALPASALALTKRQFYRLDAASSAEDVRVAAQVDSLARRTPGLRAGISP